MCVVIADADANLNKNIHALLELPPDSFPSYLPVVQSSIVLRMKYPSILYGYRTFSKVEDQAREALLANIH
jgi:hypothetical protein